ncbi:MAG: hypothetical protein DHS20C15_17000 [Planctomycetota bacterium]|nr:MAG: hypothetical protein DHS20C15_17000 [Planctomycetota bacterium]
MRLHLLVALGLSFFAAPVLSQELAARRPLDLGPLRVPVLNTDALDALAAPPRFELQLKFSDAALARLTSAGRLESRAGLPIGAAQGLLDEQGVSLRPLVQLSETRLLALQSRAATRSGVAQPDLAGLFAVNESELSLERLAQLGQALQELDLVEFAQFELLAPPPPGDIAPATPDLSGNQNYFAPSSGMDVDYARSVGALGAGVRIADCEYGWNPDHEDLNDININLEPGQTIHPSVYSNGWDSHGTAVIGETSAVVNGYGVSGIAPDADVATYTEWSVQQGLRRVTAITNAIADSAPGDVVLLEMQTGGAGGGLGPAELNGAVFTVVKTGTDAGVVVVGAAGNGSQDLDAPAYAGYLAQGDSGAIIVGAGSAGGSHSTLSFSTFGSRVNVQGWGTSVFTLGYGGFAQYGGDKNQRYTSTFNGTSSASPFVAAACAIVQSEAKAMFGVPLVPQQLRALLVDTGTAQGGGGHIGPLPDLKAALQALPFVDSFPAEWVDIGGGLAGSGGVPVATGEGSLFAGSTAKLKLANGTFFTDAYLVWGFSRIDVAFRGGVMIPAPDILTGPFFVTVGGSTNAQGPMPSGVPSDLPIYFQWWTNDASGPLGWTASNGLEVFTP